MLCPLAAVAVPVSVTGMANGSVTVWVDPALTVGGVAGGGGGRDVPRVLISIHS